MNMHIKQEVKVENPEAEIFDNSLDDACENYEPLDFLMKIEEGKQYIIFKYSKNFKNNFSLKKTTYYFISRIILLNFIIYLVIEFILLKNLLLKIFFFANTQLVCYHTVSLKYFLSVLFNLCIHNNTISFYRNQYKTNTSTESVALLIINEISYNHLTKTTGCINEITYSTLHFKYLFSDVKPKKPRKTRKKKLTLTENIKAAVKPSIFGCGMNFINKHFNHLIL